jgi:hypothetical protein
MARVTKPAVNLRETLAELKRPAPTRRETFWTSGDTTTTVFPLEDGWKPTDVFVGGAIQRPGGGEDYTVGFDGFVYSVVFAVAPAAVSIAIQAEA